MNLFQSYSSLIRSSGAGDKVFALLDRSPPAPATGSLSVQQSTSPITYNSPVSIKLENVSFVYPSRPNIPVLKNLTLTVRQGQTLALVGPSGCGKSTVVGLLQRFYDPAAGTILVNDTNLQTLNLKDYRWVPFRLFVVYLSRRGNTKRLNHLPNLTQRSYWSSYPGPNLVLGNYFVQHLLW